MFPDDFPYVTRVVSDILESNGSSSMATVCAGTLALLDAGVKMKRPVAGIAMGLISDGQKYAVLSDILGDEDHLGDMDFKVTGTTNGITATQMDIKCDGLSYEILEKALMQAREGRLHILNIINETIPAPREDYKPHVPRIVTMLIPKDLIGAVIGPGGKIIQGIQEESGATVSIEEIAEGGHIEVAASNKDSIDKALAMINAIVELPEEGKVYTGKVMTIQDFGAFVSSCPTATACSTSLKSHGTACPTWRHRPQGGRRSEVKLIEIDKKTGKYRLSMRALQPKPEGWVERPREPRRPRGEGGEGGERRERRDRGDRGPRSPRTPRRD